LHELKQNLFSFHAGGLLRLPLSAVTSCLKSVRADMKPVAHAYLRAKFRCDDHGCTPHTHKWRLSTGCDEKQRKSTSTGGRSEERADPSRPRYECMRACMHACACACGIHSYMYPVHTHSYMYPVRALCIQHTSIYISTYIYIRTHIHT